MEVVVEFDEIGSLTDLDPTAIRDADHRQRVATGRRDRSGQCHAGTDEVSNGGVEGDDGTGERRRPGEGDAVRR